jgi:A/G-specific adenine glycosylase
MEPTDIISFQKTVWDDYAVHGRHDLPWRLPMDDGTFDPYHIVVSELMLQQTQVLRVIPKFKVFIATYPSFKALARASLADVLVLWSGLGYNRRAKFLWELAQQVITSHGGVLPKTREQLVQLPGIGSNTAGAVQAYAHNTPVVFIETNIRTVYIHHFFRDQQAVSDKSLLPILEETLPEGRAREWYWALMDYGTYLKQSVGNISRASASYAKQSAFSGSRRQVRGQVIRLLGSQPYTYDALTSEVADTRLPDVLSDLTKEGFIEQIAGQFQLRA